ncbi:ferritin-like domain-containing protein [uncultured Sphingomonas sp.]|uniref:ferritin-like domain-containing protein n=1 Tax=uncultured Sphingomonas sp. TaxID=158754 RepID=UPI0035C97B4D
MHESEQLIEAFDRRVKRRDERREFFKMALGAAAVGAGAFAFASAADAQTVTDADILNFALNLEYLEAQFYSYAFSGAGLPDSLLGGVTTAGARGNVDTGGTNPPRAVDFTGEPLIQQYAREIAADEIAHVTFLRSAGALGAAAVAQPRINISGGLNADGSVGSFTAAGRAAGVVTPSGPNGTFLATDVFDPYASPNNFLLGSFIFEDVGVTAYKGSAALITNNAFLDAAAGILAVEAFHAGIIRGALYRRGINTPALVTATTKIAAARDSLDGTPTADPVRGIDPNDDQGVAPVQIAVTNSAGTTTATGSNFVPTNVNGLAYSRSAAQVLNIVYLNRAAVTLGGFFPAGVNGTIRTSAAN